MGADLCHLNRINPPVCHGQSRGSQDQLTPHRVEKETVDDSSSAQLPEGRTAESLDDGTLYVVEDLDGVRLVHADDVLGGRVEGHLDDRGRVTSVDKASVREAGAKVAVRIAVDKASVRSGCTYCSGHSQC